MVTAYATTPAPIRIMPNSKELMFQICSCSLRMMEKASSSMGGDADRDGAEQSPRNAERARQVRFAEAEHGKGNELQRQADAVKQDIDGDQSIKAKAQTHGPAGGADQNCDPGARAWAAAWRRRCGSMPSCAMANGRRE